MCENILDQPEKEYPHDVINERVLSFIKHGAYTIQITEHQCRDSDYNYIDFISYNNQDSAKNIDSNCLLETCLQIAHEYGEKPFHLLKLVVDTALYKYENVKDTKTKIKIKKYD